MLIFDIPTKPQYKNQVVFGVSIPLLGELTVNEAIAVDKAIVTDIKTESTNTEWMIVQVTAWLAVRLGTDKEELTAQLYKSKSLIDALWAMFVKEREGITTDYETEEPVTEGKDEDPTVPLPKSRKNGIKSTSDSHQVALAQNLAMDLDSNE
jgi:hypothetical protein